jgi:glutathione S-transferase
VAVTLFVVHNSHPCVAVAKALELKGLEYRVIEWPPPLHPLLQHAMFGVRTVPAVRIDNEKLSGSRAIMHRLDELVPEPALYPEAPEAREAVEGADRWGDEQFQQVARDLIWIGARHRPSALVSYAQGSKLPMPEFLIRAFAPGIALGGARLNRTDDAKAAARLEALPGQLDVVDGWIADGTIGDSDHPNAADLQLLSTVRLLQSMVDVRPLLAGRPCLAAAGALWPPVLGELPAGTLP